MTAPLEILPDRVYMVTRRCAQRMFLLRPDEDTTQTFLYCLAYAAEKAGVDVLFSVVMSSHHHTIIYDREGTISRFTHYLHGLTGRAVNILRGRRENFWAKEQTNLLYLVELDDVLEKMAYAAINPVKAGLVEQAEQWPGLNTTEAFLSGASLSVQRPRHFFRAKRLPVQLTLSLGWPAALGPVEKARQRLRERIDALEAQARQERIRNGQRVLGREAVRKQSFLATPQTPEPRRRLRPTIAAINPWVRMTVRLGYRAFLEAYRTARACLIKGLPALFPPGTYWLRHNAGVTVLE